MVPDNVLFVAGMWLHTVYIMMNVCYLLRVASIAKRAGVPADVINYGWQTGGSVKVGRETGRAECKECSVCLPEMLSQ